MDRRTFIKDSALFAGAAALAACTGGRSNGESASTEISGEMTYRQNPGNGDKVGILGYGCMRWPNRVDEETGRQELDQEQINRLVDRALEAGVNYFDTAPMYLGGHSETATGIALARHPRDSYFIATKMSNFSAWDFDSSKQLYQRSFESLQTDYIDYYLLHSIGDINGFNKRFIENGLLDFLASERKEGRIRNLGFSFHGGSEAFDYLMSLHDTYHWDFVQIQMNYVDWKTAGADYLYGELDKREIPVVIMEPLLGGRLASVPEHIARKLQEREPARSIASWAFRFCGTYPRVLTVLSGMTYMEHLEDNLKSFSPLVPLQDGELEFLDGIAGLIAAYPTVPCTACEYCMPCPYGIDIPGIFAHYNKCVNEGDMATSGSPDWRRARRRYLASYARAIMPERQADKCIGCEQCRPKCPQHINIPRQMRRIDEYVENLKKGI